MSEGRSRRGAGGFTLIETMVTIGIIIFLGGLAVTAMTHLGERSEIQRTQRTIDLLDRALREWQTAAGRTLTWGHAEGSPHRYDIDSEQAARAPILVISDLLGVIGRAGPVRSVLAEIDPADYYRYDPAARPPWIRSYSEEHHLAELFERYGHPLAVLDAWGTPLYPTHPGAPYASLNEADRRERARDADGTERTRNETRFGVDRNRRLNFVSAGPDRRFGLAREFYRLPNRALEKAKRAARRDNRYLYAPDWP